MNKVTMDRGILVKDNNGIICLVFELTYPAATHATESFQV